jgi:hypothetical protein
MAEMTDLRSGGQVRGGSSAAAPAVRPLPPRPSTLRLVPDQAGGPQANMPVRIPSERKPRPDPGPIRIAVGLTGMATATALITAFLSPAAGTTAGASGGATPITVASTTDPIVAAAAEPSVRHVIRYVQLQPGQTAPPAAVVQQAPAPAPATAVVKPAPTPKPRVVVVTTRQSGK